MKWALARRGVTGQVHACVVQPNGRLLTACGRTIAPASVTVWRSLRLIRKVWEDDETRRCGSCSRRCAPVR